MTDLTKDTAWQKANKLIQEKYGKSLSYRSLKLITDVNMAKQSESFYTSGDDLIIPLKLKNYDLGDVIVGRGSFLDQQQISEVVDLIKFLVEPKLYSLQLKKSEANLLSINTNKLSVVDTNRVVELYHSEKFRKQTLSQIILLKSHTEFTRNKVALKIHEMTQRNLFVHLEDIIASLSSKEDFKTLNDVTIYIQDVQKLTKENLILLQEFLELNSQEGPLFLVGSTLSMDAIEAQDWPKELKKDLQGFYFDIDRVPLSQQTSEDILELLFFQLDSVLS
jgi:hypothetical protein